MTGESENPECLAGRDDQPHVDVACGGPLVREVQLMHACCAAPHGVGEVGDHNCGTGIEGLLHLFRYASRVSDVDVLGQGHDSGLTALPHLSADPPHQHAPYVQLVARIGHQEPARTGELTERVGQYDSS
jgi:hypothetical protein